MFTGIIEEIGQIKNISTLSNGAEIIINCSEILNDIKIGDSISVNGVCQTVTSYNDSSFKAMLSGETLQVTNFSNEKSGNYVNLERAIKIDSRLGGHIVTGHIDCLGKLVSKEKQDVFTKMTFQIPEDKLKYIIYKGSITINGISLTISETENNSFSIAVIPHTYNNTVLKYLNIRDEVNIETDIIGKYVEKMLGLGNNNQNSKINIDFLKENGFV